MTMTSEATTPSTPVADAGDSFDPAGPRRWWLVALGPVVALVLALLLPSSLPVEGRVVAGTAAWMALWWMTEAAPIPVTSLLPLAVFPLLDSASMSDVAAPYANPVVFLVMGGVILGLATERSNLHTRIALLTIRAVGTRSSQMVLGLMLASALISAWVSNTATAVIMVPIAVSVLHLVREVATRRPQARSLPPRCCWASPTE
ncbi:SLC13 family permease [Ornithinimicrobium sp. W1665]|uniref:SLC13 family permease n=1 Tax=Ornithinimicrobium sp. W1665 TaxID=3416666 RepID=UPI003D6BF8A3